MKLPEFASPESELIPNPMRRKRKNENARVASPRNDTLNWNKLIC